MLSSSTVDKLNYKFSEIRNKYQNNRQHNRAGFSVSYLRWPAHQCITHLPDDEKANFENRLRKCIDDLKPDVTKIGSLYLEEDQINRLINFMNSEKADPKQQANFASFFDEYDKRRNVTMLQVFPELRTMYENGKNYLK